MNRLTALRRLRAALRRADAKHRKKKNPNLVPRPWNQWSKKLGRKRRKPGPKPSLRLQLEGLEKRRRRAAAAGKKRAGHWKPEIAERRSAAAQLATQAQLAIVGHNSHLIYLDARGKMHLEEERSAEELIANYEKSQNRKTKNQRGGSRQPDRTAHRSKSRR